MRKENEMELLSRMGRFFPSRAPTSIDLVGYRLLRINNEPDQYNLTYQYGYGQKWLLVNVAFRDLSSEGKQIIAFNVSPIERSLQEIHKFSLQGKGSMHYSFLIICTTCPLFIFSTLIVCIKTKLKKRKWLWIPFVMLGMVQFSLNWTTGQFWIKLLSIQLLGTGAVSASIYSPWILSFSLPVGAIIFWIKRLKDRRTGVGEGRRGSEEDQSSVS